MFEKNQIPKSLNYSHLIGMNLLFQVFIIAKCLILIYVYDYNMVGVQFSLANQCTILYSYQKQRHIEPSMLEMKL